MKLTPKRQGDPIVLPVQGGFVRRPAPVDGFHVEVGETSGFISADDFGAALVNLKLMREKPRARRRRR